MWSNDASSRVLDLISVLFELHKEKSPGLFNSIRRYSASTFKVLCQIPFEKIDLTIMERAAAAYARAVHKVSIRLGCPTNSNFFYVRYVIHMLYIRYPHVIHTLFICYLYVI